MKNLRLALVVVATIAQSTHTEITRHRGSEWRGVSPKESVPSASRCLRVRR